MTLVFCRINLSAKLSCNWRDHIDVFGYLEARHHVRSGRTVISAQLDLIARRKASGVEQLEDLLNAFERTQAIFEDDLKRIVREGKKT